MHPSEPPRVKDWRRVIGLVELARVVAEPTVVARALKVSLVAGTLYNLINQGEKIAHLAFADINYLKLSLTYLMPYLVSTYTSVSMKLVECRVVPVASDSSGSRLRSTMAKDNSTCP